MKIIKCSTSDTFIKVDDEDFERINSFNWTICGKHKVTISRCKSVLIEYVSKYGFNKKKRIGKNIPIANEVMQNFDVIYDHIDNDFTNNQKSNLRVCTFAQNSANKKKYHKSGTSKYKGVRLHAQNKWTAQLQFNRRQIYLGYFNNEEDAARAYDKKAIELWGEFASLNFPRTVGTTTPTDA